MVDSFQWLGDPVSCLTCVRWVRVFSPEHAWITCNEFGDDGFWLRVAGVDGTCTPPALNIGQEWPHWACFLLFFAI